MRIYFLLLSMYTCQVQYSAIAMLVYINEHLELALLSYIMINNNIINRIRRTGNSSPPDRCVVLFACYTGKDGSENKDDSKLLLLL